MAVALTSVSFLFLFVGGALVSAQVTDCNAANLKNPCYTDANWTLYIEPTLDAQSNTYLDVQVQNIGVASMVNRWMAVAFSTDDKMGNDIVIGCASYNGSNVLVADYSYNDNTPTNIRIPGWTQTNTDALLSLVKFSMTDHNTFCHFQFKFNQNLSGVNSMYLLDGNQKKFTILVASGPTNSLSNPGESTAYGNQCLVSFGQHEHGNHKATTTFVVQAASSSFAALHLLLIFINCR